MNRISQAMIFAAGLGTRLRPLTDHIPKALVEVDGKTLLERVILKLQANGVERVVVNVHHFHQKVRRFLAERKFGTEIIISDESGLLLDTGGGLKHAAHFFDKSKPLLLHNVDVLSGIDFGRMLSFHLDKNALATLFVQNRSSSRYLLFDADMHLAGWKNVNTGEEIYTNSAENVSSQLAFNGIHIINPQVFDLIDESGKFSIIPLYLRLAAGCKIMGYRDDNIPYLDIGKKDSVEEATRRIAQF
jgi:N-acetyl-alpha-D-muramate 1-phosphate uridylyltransferase